MTGFEASEWSGDEQLLWINATAGDELKLGLQVERAGSFEITAVFTTALDYGTVDVWLDDQIVVESLNLFRPGGTTAVNTLERSLGRHHLRAGKHTLRILMKDGDQNAVDHRGFGLDALRFKRLDPVESAP